MVSALLFYPAFLTISFRFPFWGGVLLDLFYPAWRYLSLMRYLLLLRSVSAVVDARVILSSMIPSRDSPQSWLQVFWIHFPLSNLSFFSFTLILWSESLFLFAFHQRSC